VEGGDPVRVRVTDNGCGIAPEHRARIFEPFFSLRKGGTGLGLFLSLNFVRRWRGDIRVESTPGHGATFEMILPAPERAGDVRAAS
jgi:signal transduction histidine kinase